MPHATLSKNQPFLTDVKQLRAQAHMNIEDGALTKAYEGRRRAYMHDLLVSHEGRPMLPK